MKDICIVTGTRAEYGLLKPIIKKILLDDDLNLKLVVTGMHLCSEFGLTYKEIENDNINIDEKIEIILSSDSNNAISKSIGIGIISFSEYFKRNKFDILILLGDRYEIFAVAVAASIEHIPIAHISGGDTTEGAYDEFFRHSITKMSYLHFTGEEKSKYRVIQLGESPDRVFNVGELGVENALGMKLMSKSELENDIKFKLDTQFALITFHPVTMENDKTIQQFRELLNALDNFVNMKFIFTKANADSCGRIINKMIDKYVEYRKHCIAFESLGTRRYLSTMRYATVIIGNSSSGLIEAPSFNVATVNIGNRQKGRTCAKSVINCAPVEKDIVLSINRALIIDLKDIINPYQGKNTSSSILKIIKEFLINKKINLSKTFYDLGRD